MSVLHLFYDLLHLVFPKVCLACGHALFEREEVICFSCLYKLPKTAFHLHAENPVSRMFWGRTDIHAATSFLFFSKGGRVQHLIHALKYKGHKEAGVYLGKLLGIDLKKSELYKDVDLVVPVPLHRKKQYKRGFNQSECIAEGISKGMKIPFVAGNLIREVHTSTQTKKSRYKRWDNVKGVFGLLQPAVFENRHLLLVDDVLTTGATLESCTQCLLEVPGVRVSVATLACALG
ncbi:MAG: ComF family protein [Bacteroidales bacterium]|nr:ComF family protein [Bacteroidales bacterium]MCF6341346.1 ComF family protein [Bacteroidales bacterium]